MTRRIRRIAVQAATLVLSARSLLGCWVIDSTDSRTTPVDGAVEGGVVILQEAGVVISGDTGVVDSGPATGPSCRGDLDCTQGVRRHCILDPGRAGFCVQCAPAQGFTCPVGETCSSGVCVAGGAAPLTGPPCRTDTECVTSDRRRCVADGSPSGSRVCVQCDPTLPCTPGSTCANGLCVGEGALRFTLTWDRPGDVDLHVVTPSGTEIFYGARTQAGGTLDRDDTTGTGPENVFWAASPPSGTYLVCVVPFSISGPTGFRLTIARNGVEVGAPVTGTRASSTGNVVCSRTAATFVTELRVP